ncbi:MAG TPA: hypothetical protein VJ825_10325 [Gemmatimonadaceae bacterium]|nr:hypothetical protein [Gemmatimonadaceae bacterium]
MFRIPLFALTLTVVPTAATVSGSGTITFGSSVEHITVNATGSSGRATFQDKAAGGNVNGQIDINCVNIVGNTATLSGLVTHSNKKSMIGQEGVFRIVDNGSKKSAPDFATLINFHTPGTSTDCNAGEFDLTPVKGDFTIR